MFEPRRKHHQTVLEGVNIHVIARNSLRSDTVQAELAPGKLARFDVEIVDSAKQPLMPAAVVATKRLTPRANRNVPVAGEVRTIAVGSDLELIMVYRKGSRTRRREDPIQTICDAAHEPLGPGAELPCPLRYAFGRIDHPSNDRRRTKEGSVSEGPSEKLLVGIFSEECLHASDRRQRPF
jgi:hypothetical protein